MVPLLSQLQSTGQIVIFHQRAMPVGHGSETKVGRGLVYLQERMK